MFVLLLLHTMPCHTIVSPRLFSGTLISPTAAEVSGGHGLCDTAGEVAAHLNVKPLRRLCRTDRARRILLRRLEKSVCH
jgi:hypothetical protein